MKRARIDHLHAAAKTRKPGYLEACLHEGKISGGGQWVIFSDEAHAKIRKQFNPNPSAASLSQRERAGVRGFGDLIHKFAGPIGRAIRWPCVKRDGTTNLKPGSPCDRARRALNTVKVYRDETVPRTPPRLHVRRVGQSPAKSRLVPLSPA